MFFSGSILRRLIAVAFLRLGFSLLKKLVIVFKMPDILPYYGYLITRLLRRAKGTPLLADLTRDRHNIAAEGRVGA